jgi:hypothetical protein
MNPNTQQRLAADQHSEWLRAHGNTTSQRTRADTAERSTRPRATRIVPFAYGSGCFTS